MQLSIPRGIVYHRVVQDIANLVRAVFAPLNNQQRVLEFEKKFAAYMGAKNCVAFPFARTAIFYALKSKGLPKGSEIIMPPITIKQILDVVIACELKPVFVDIDPETLCFDIEKLRGAMGPNTKAILPTYLFGMVPDLGKILALCKERNLFVIEDFSQCLNGEFSGQKVGTFGDVGIYSSSSIKTLDTYGGGLLISNDDGLCMKLREYQRTLPAPSRIALVKKVWTDLVRNVATTRLVFHYFTFPLIRWMTKLNPRKVIKHVGTRDTQMLKALPRAWFERYTSFQADVGLNMLSGVVEGDSVRTKNVALIKTSTSRTKLKFPQGAEKSKNVYWQFVAYSEDPFETQKYFQSKKVDTSTTSLIHIANLPSYPYQGVTPNAERLHSNGIFIPAYPGLSKNEIQYIVQALNEQVPETQL